MKHERFTWNALTAVIVGGVFHVKHSRTKESCSAATARAGSGLSAVLDFAGGCTTSGTLGQTCTGRSPG